MHWVVSKALTVVTSTSTRQRLSIFSAALVLATFAAHAQTPSIPRASRTVFKCTVDGKVVYTDDPCIGATRIDLQPTEGMNRITGKELTGRDVSIEKSNRHVAEAVKPITGLSPEQFEVKRRRIYLPNQVKLECDQLDHSVARSESQERLASSSQKTVLQQELLAYRKRSRDLKC